ncbi:site-specific integrase [Candidatus Woesearchaeota archaeon]|nr:site-specific integrase [Candidatus Woesearchaeota archaeon]
MRKIPNYLNKHQILKLFDVTQEPDVMIAIFLALFCGLRIGEVVKLRKCDFDFEKRFLKIVNGKSPNKSIEGYGKDRMVALPQHVIIPLKMWFDVIGNNEYLFPSITFPNKHLSLAHLEKKYWVCLEKAGLRDVERIDSAGRKIRKYNFHTLRHTYATLLWEKTGDIYAVKNALGHSIA